ncbi:hypothetical protein [Saccharibacillus sacchari]|uniref:hypothetical protein n=1 Tax=Saccharibacillus sacchari TaxID=456493 RepID=UPI0004B7EA3D|nr:hypothetical protein [Saccharibacillus sacchari]
MKKRRFPAAVILLALLTACSADPAPDSIGKDSDTVTAVKKIPDSDFELRLIAERVEQEDNVFKLEAGLRYTGDQPEATVMHGDPLFYAGLTIDGEQVNGPIAISTVGLFTPLAANEWHTRDVSIQSSRTQIKQFYAKGGEITLHAEFSADDYANGSGYDATLSLKSAEILHEKEG